MPSPTLHSVGLFVKRRRRLLFNLFVILATVLTLFPKARPAYAAAATSVKPSTVAQNTGNIDPCDLIPIPPGSFCGSPYPPAELLYLGYGGSYGSTPAQVASLRALENQAVAIVLELHKLPAEDAAAVRTWGRDDVMAQLYLLLVSAIKTDAAERTADQQNAVDWIAAMAQRQNVESAVNAAREYVKWAGLGRLQFDSLMSTNPTKAQIEAFLSGPVVNYDFPAGNAPGISTEGWCIYRSPAPYESEYTGYNNPLCSGPVLGFILPPTPSYDEFVKWGTAKAHYSLLSSGGFQSRINNLGIALGVAVPLSAVISSSALYAAAVIQAAYINAAAIEAVELALNASTRTVSVASQAANVFRIVGAFSLAITLIAAIATAVLVGINVTDAANLPGKLATLVDTARTTTPDVTTLIDDTDSTTTLLTLFAGATTPEPSLNSCDNTNIIPGMYTLTIIGTDQTSLVSNALCLNPTRIPSASDTDPQFIVKNAAGVETLVPSITLKDSASGAGTVVRMSGNWFVTQSNGTTIQTLRIGYTDWDGNAQNAWLIGGTDSGYSFLTFSFPDDTSTTISPETCLTDGFCGLSTSIEYIGTDGQHYSARLRGFQAATGTPTVTGAAEGNPATLEANGFAPGGAVEPVSYRWSFKGTDCALVIGLPCSELASLTGSTVSYTWNAGGTYQVDLTATDAVGAQATTTLQVPVQSLPPTFALAPDCATSPNTPCNSWSGNPGSSVAVRGTMWYAGSASRFQVTVDWGDGTTSFATIGSDGSVGTIPPGGVSPFTITRVPGELAYTILAPYTYTSPGVYNGTITVREIVGLFGDGGTVTRPFTFDLMGQQSIEFPLIISGRSYGEVFTVGALGGGSGQPVTFSAVGVCTLSNSSGEPDAGSATVTVSGVGDCEITARQAGSAGYNPAPPVTRRFFSVPAQLTVTAPSATLVYGQPAPALTPSYSGFKLSDTASSLTTPASCTVAPNTGGVGTYATSCSGAAGANYSFDYVPGTLTINQAPLTITANDKSMTYGGSVPAFDAQLSGLVNGETSAVVSGLSCSATDGSGQPIRSNTPVGTYPITCSGAAAPNYSLSYTPGTLTIAKASTTTALSASPSASVFGQPVTFTAAVALVSPGSGQPGGTVSFMDGTTPIAGCADRPLDASGIATCTTAALGVATHAISATYSGDSSFAGAAASLNHTVAAVVAVRRAPTLNSGSRVEGALWLLSGEAVTINGGAVAGDLLVPGSPTVVRNSGTIGSTVAGSGSATPSGYLLTLNGGANVTRLLTRTDAVALPSVPSVPAPTGTRLVQVNRPGQALGDPATIRNLTLNGGAGAVSLPAGTYGRLTANSGTSFVLGVPNATTPSVYNLQGLTLNGGQVTVVGPVIINLASGFTLNSGARMGGPASGLEVNVASGAVQLNGVTAFYGTLRAPTSLVTLNSGARLEGMLFADRLVLNGGTVRTTP